MARGVCEGLSISELMTRTGWYYPEKHLDDIYHKLGFTGNSEEQKKKLIEIVNAEKKS